LESQFQHKSVLLQECIANLNINPDGVYVDGTLGGAGHSSEILARLGKNGVLIGLDQDEAAIKASTVRLQKVESQAKYHLLKTNFVNLIEACKTIGYSEVDGILLDLGVSSYQFDTGDRGFSYRFDAPLDMRMDQQQELTADYVVNNYTVDALKKIFWAYGEERWAARIAKIIEERRSKKRIETTGELVEVIKAAIPLGARKEGGHPAKRTFQAIRIEVNHELDVLTETIGKAIDLLAPGGRLCIITFHSLEDRIVKNKFREASNPCKCPSDFPVCVCGKKPLGKILTGKPIVAGEEELNDNPRAKSAGLRVFAKLI